MAAQISETEAETLAAAGEERLRRHRAARDRARSSSTHRNMERLGNASSGSHSIAELRRSAETTLDTHVGNSIRADSRLARTRPRHAAMPTRRSPSATSRRQRGVPRGSSREATSGHELPPVPLWQEPEDLEARWQEYIRSQEYVTLQAAVDCLRTLPSMDDLTERRVDFEVVLHLLHRLGTTLEVEHVSKSYRAHYSPDVQLCGYLYSTLLTAFTLLPSYVLNGQEFYVSDTVLDQCKSLQFVFQETCTELKKMFESLQSYSLEQIRKDIKRTLVYFDRSWCRFEMPALEEIEAIHRQACRPLIEAIEADQTLLACESKVSSSTRGSAAPGTQRVKLQVAKTRLMEKLCELNRLANVDGKGRADMDLTCILEAERIAGKPMCMHLRKEPQRHPSDTPSAQENVLVNPLQALHKCTGCTSPVLLRIARSLLRSWTRIRRILQRYANCLYQLNSHLANNRDLVRGLELFESSWETASRYLVQSGPRRLALLTYSIVSSVQDAEFESSLNNFDPGFLVASLPRALILHEMRRFAAAKAAAAGHSTATDMGTSVHPLKGAPTANTCLPKIATTRAVLHAAAATAMLPRPLDVRRVPSSAFQHSPIARAFLPEEVVETYNETAVSLDRLPSTRIPVVCSLLISPPRGNSHSTPLRTRTGNRQSKTAEPIPRTPCPPRMAVPNTSGPTSVGCTPQGSRLSPQITAIASSTSLQPGVQAAHQPQVASSDELAHDSDDEEDTFSIDLTAQIQNVELGQTAATMAAVVSGAEQDTGAPASHREGGHDPATRRVVASISTLALYLQRSKPHEWNELIQVVLQGFMLMKSASTKQQADGNAAEQAKQTHVERVGAGPIPSEVW